MDYGRSRASAQNAIPRGIHSPRFHHILYGVLLVATPFIMVRNFMQDAVGRVSASTFPCGPWRVPLVPTAAIIVLLVSLVVLRRRITRRMVLAGLIALVMFAIGQRLSDHYFGHRFYELQQNWHYLAYGLFAFVVRRDLLPRGVPVARWLLITFVLAAGCSTFDEAFQLFFSNRVFDMSDIGKDIWGTVTGLTLLMIGSGQAEFAPVAWKRVRHPRVAQYFSHAPSVWLLLLTVAFFFLSYSSLLTEYRSCGTILLLTFATVVSAFLLFHFSQYRLCGRVLLGLAALVFALQMSSFVRFRRGDIVVHRYGLTVYRGIPIPFFDAMILPDGPFRLVDKKHFFTHRDQTYMNRQGADIILIGSGYQSLGGKGFPHLSGSGFLYNPFTKRGVQVVILRTSEACEYFNRLKKAGKRVLFILHSTC